VRLVFFCFTPKDYQHCCPRSYLRNKVVAESRFHVIETDDLQSEEDLQRLILLVFQHSERTFYYFQESDGKRNEFFLRASDQGDTLVYEIEHFYYKNSKFIDHYEHIPEQSAKYDWQKELVKKGPMYVRMKFKLSERKKLELETWQKIQLEDIYRQSKLEADHSCDVFLSYASTDGREANMILQAIERTGGRAFIAEKVLEPGEDFAERIREALCSSRELWLLVSPNSLKSEWVLTEWGAAWALRKKIVPILLRCDIGQLPERIRQRQCIDFHNHLELVNRTFSKN